MLIAVPYMGGEICQHFGKAPQFKFYEVDPENAKVLESVVVDTEGSGHVALGAFLSGRNVDIVLCGGIGQGAIVSLATAGIDIIPGVFGNPDEAVAALLDGTLVAGSPGAGCGCGCGGHGHDHHEGETCGCGGHGHDHHEGETCGCGGHHHHEEGTCGCGGHHGQEKGGCGCH